MSERTNRLQVCIIEGNDPIVRLKGWTPAGAYEKLTNEAQDRFNGEFCNAEFDQYQEIGEATVDTQTGDVIQIELDQKTE